MDDYGTEQNDNVMEYDGDDKSDNSTDADDEENNQEDIPDEYRDWQDSNKNICSVGLDSTQ